MVGVTNVERFHGQVPSGSPYTQDHFIATTDGVLGCVVLASGATSWDAADDNTAMFSCGFWENSARTPFNSKHATLWSQFRNGLAAYLGRAHGQDAAAICWCDGNANVKVDGAASEYNSGGNKGVTLTFTAGGGTGNPSIQYCYEILVFYGSGKFACDLIKVPNNTTGAVTEWWDPGFVAEQAIFMAADQFWTPSKSYRGRWHFAASYDDGGSAPFPTRSIGVGGQDGSGNHVVSVHNDGYIVSMENNGAISKKYRVEDWSGDTGGQSIGLTNWQGGASSNVVMCVAWTYDDGRQIELQTSPSPASTPWADSDFTNDLDLCVLVGTPVTSQNTTDATANGDQASWFISLFDDTNESVVGGLAASNETTQYTKSFGDDVRTALTKSGEGGSSSTLLDSGASPTVSMSGGFSTSMSTTAAYSYCWSIGFPAAAAAEFIYQRRQHAYLRM